MSEAEPSALEPLVTAVITTHQRPDLLRSALRSVLAERYANLEIIVAEDGTSLRRADLPDDPRIRLVGRPVGGCAAARNLGLEAARGEFVIYLDDDDTARPNRIADLAAAAGAESDLSYGQTIKRSGARTVTIPAWPESDRPVSFLDLLVHMPHVDSVLMRASALRAVGGFDVEATNFDEFSAWLRMLDRGGRGAFRAVPVADWTSHEEGLSGAMSRDRSMGPSLVRLLQRVERFAVPAHARAAAAVRRAVERSPIAGFEDYVRIASTALCQIDQGAGRED